MPIVTVLCTIDSRSDVRTLTDLEYALLPLSN